MASNEFSTNENQDKIVDEAYEDVSKAQIDLREYMSEEDLAKMCDLEKTVSMNRLRNYLVMKKLGTNIRPPEFLTKSQRPYRRPNMPEKNMDPTWKPGKQGKKSRNWKPAVRNINKNAKNASVIQREKVESPQAVPSTSQPVEREPFYEFRHVDARRLLYSLQNELEFMLFLKETAEKKLIDCDELDFLDPTVGCVFANKADRNDPKKRSIQVDEFPLTEGRRDFGFEVHQMESRDCNDLISANYTEKEKCVSLFEDKEKPHRCSQCNKSFKRKSHLSRHMRIHTGEKPCECSVCGMKFNQLSNRNRHMRIHTGEKRFQCSVYGMKFIDSSSRNVHMRIHTGEKPFGCSVCGVKLSDPSSHSRHMRIHTGEKPFGCSVCGMKFNRSGNRNTHMRIHTGEKLLKSHA